MDIQIGEIVAEVTVDERGSTLGAEELQRIVGMVLDAVRREREQNARRDRDTRVSDRFFQH